MASRREDLGSWLEGTPGGGEPEGVSRLGLPLTGRGSLASVPRRIVAVGIDWMLCLLIASAFFPDPDAVAGSILTGDPLATLAVFGVSTFVLVALLGNTVGQRLVGLRVSRLQDVPTTRPPGPWAAAVRTVLLCLVIPAAVWDAAGRGLHDTAARTVIVRG